MSGNAHVSLRDRLRRDTRAEHDCLDVAVSAFDLTDPTDLGAFLSVQFQGFAHLAESPGLDGPLTQQLGDLVARAGRDLDRLTFTRPGALPARSYSPAAVEYITLGSRMGTAVLRRRWSTATHPLVSGASAYFSAPPGGADWRAYCEAAELLSGHTAFADRIVIDVRNIFALFSEIVATHAPMDGLQLA